MRFTGAVVADKKDALVVAELFKLQLSEHGIRNSLFHVVGHDIAANQLFFFRNIVGIRQLNDGRDRVKADKLRIFHDASSYLTTRIWYLTQLYS